MILKKAKQVLSVIGVIRATHYFDLRAVSQLLDRVHVFSVVLQENGHLKRGSLNTQTHTHTNVKSKVISELVCIDSDEPKSGENRARFSFWLASKPCCWISNGGTRSRTDL